MRAWRGLAVLAVWLAAACSVDVNGAKFHGGPYSVEIREVGDTHLYVVRGPSGKVAAARSGGGGSALLDADELQHALAAMPTPNAKPDDDNDQAVSIHAPGFDMHVSGDNVHVNDAGNGKPSNVHTAASVNDHEGRGHVTMNIGGFGMHVDADDGGPGAGDDRAQVTLTGMSAHDARHFIAEQDDLSPQVQAQMIAALGLPENDADAAPAHRLAGGDGDDDKPAGK
jgi:hypothetical protein